MKRRMFVEKTLMVALALAAFLVTAAEPANAAFPGTNGRVAFDQSDGNDSEIYTINPDGSGLIQITDNAFDDVNPAWSSDGTKLAYSSEAGADSEIFTIAIGPAGGPAGSRVQITNNSEDDDQPTFSPAGDQIAYTKLGCSADIYRTGATGGGTEVPVVVSDTSWSFQPAWSPDGSRIAYASANLGSTGCPTALQNALDGGPESAYESAEEFFSFDIYTINADGTGSPTAITNSGLLNQNPNWAANGERISFDGVPTAGEATNSEIFTTASDGSTAGNPTQVTDSSAAGTDNENPAYSPDGAQIAYETCPCSGVGDVYRISSNAIKGAGIPITNLADGLEALAPDWQPLNADLALTKTAAPKPVREGNNLTYALTVTNKGPNTATGVTLTDPLPSSVTFVSASSGCTNSGGTVVCGVGTLSNGASATRKIVVRANRAGGLSNTATVRGSVRDPNPANGKSTTTLTVTPQPPPNPRGCTITGTNGPNILIGTPKRDVICGLGGNDVISGLGGNDVLYGDGGRDVIKGDPGNDYILGGSDGDVLYAGSGNDRVYGEGGNDVLSTVDGVRRNDLADGGPGRNVCATDPGDWKLRCL